MIGRIRKTESALSRQNSRSSSLHRRNLPDQGNLYWAIDCKRATGIYDKDLLCGLSARLEVLPQSSLHLSPPAFFAYSKKISRRELLVE